MPIKTGAYPWVSYVCRLTLVRSQVVSESATARLVLRHAPVTNCNVLSIPKPSATQLDLDRRRPRFLRIGRASGHAGRVDLKIPPRVKMSARMRLDMKRY